MQSKPLREGEMWNQASSIQVPSSLAAAAVAQCVLKKVLVCYYSSNAYVTLILVAAYKQYHLRGTLRKRSAVEEVDDNFFSFLDY